MIKTLTLIQTMVYEQYRAAEKRLSEPFDKYENWRKQAKLLKLSKEAKQRLEWFIFYQTKAQGNASLVSRRFGIPTKTFYKWRGRFDGQNLRSLEDRSRAPIKRRRPEITPEQEMRVVALKKQYLTWGKWKIQKLYEREYAETLSAWKIQGVITKYRLSPYPAKAAKIQAKRRRSQAKKRITELKQKPFPGFLIALDCLVIHWNGTKRYILTAIDSFGKIAFARMYTTKSSRNAADFLQRVFYLLDSSFMNALHDNGSEFHRAFIEACRKLGIEQY